MSIDPRITPDRIAEVERTIRPYIRWTPMIEVNTADFDLPPFPLRLKLELLQHSGSFKVRGAFTNLMCRPVPKAGIVAASGGNHGAAVAYAAHRLGIPATIYVPRISSPAKIDRIRSYGANLVIDGESYSEALEASKLHIEKTGAMPIHAFDQAETLLGQASLAHEMETDHPGAATVLVAVGGGGLIGGIAAGYQGRIKIIAVESDGAPTLKVAFAAGGPAEAPVGGIAADSLAPRRVGELVYPIARAFVSPDVALVSDDDIRNAQALLWEKLRLVTEPGGAAAFAALLSGAYRPEPGENVIVVVCGANTTAVNFDRGS